MRINDHARSQEPVGTNAKSELSEIVMGLHWDPPEVGVASDPANLDALCVLFDGQRRVLEVIHPGQPRNADGSIIHTGDSRTGASEWDDERIFVFLEALPDKVAALTFVVVSPGGHAFGEVRGASCHVSDRVTERELVRLEFTALDRHTARCVATLYRSPTGWRVSTDGHSAYCSVLADLPLGTNGGQSAGR
jgi:stress response protein SCP2